MSDTPGFPSPTAEHQWLQSHAGQWKVACKFFTGPETMETEGTDTVEAHGPFFTLGHFRTSMFGMEFRGLATIGYDPALGKYVSTWADSFSPHLYRFEGELDQQKKVLEMRGMNPDPHTKKMVEFRTIDTEVDDNTRRFEMFVAGPGGEEIQISEYTYTRV